VLDFNKIEDGNLSVYVESFKPMDEMRDCFAIASAMAMKHDVTIELQKDVAADTVIRADRTRFKQVLLNLMTNGIKYNTAGGKVFLDCDVVEGRYLRLTVADTGKGIAADQQHLLFEPFQRLGHESSSIEGTGIGLTITKKLVTLMRGRIGFESVAGEGSTFWVDMPLDLRSHEETPAAILDGRDGTDSIAVSENGKKSMLLYVEDNLDNIRLMELILDKEDEFTMISAPNAEEGLELAAQVDPDVILMDINLPGMDGFKALQALRSRGKGRHVPVIAVTASALPSEVQRGLEAGFAAYLTKPIRIDVTLNTIREAVASKEHSLV
jgi:CheY-like chemotaxis protein